MTWAHILRYVNLYIMFFKLKKVFLLFCLEKYLRRYASILLMEIFFEYCDYKKLLNMYIYQSIWDILINIWYYIKNLKDVFEKSKALYFIIHCWLIQKLIWI